MGIYQRFGIAYLIVAGTGALAEAIEGLADKQKPVN